MRRRRRILVAVLVFLSPGLLFLAGTAAARPQDNAPANPAPAKKKHTYLDDFLVKGTVYNPQGLSFPGVQLRVRRSSEKKFRWETYTDSRGDFAVRVPPGADYQLIVRAKGFSEQSLAVDAKSGDALDALVFHMQPVQKEAKGDQK